MRHIVVDLNINADKYMAHYQGQVKDVVARALDGRRVRFPTKILQPFVSHQGIVGRFQISFDDQGRFQTIERL